MKKITLFLVVLTVTVHSQTLPDATIEKDYQISKNGYILYPSPDSDYPNIIEIGPGKTYNEIHDVPLDMVVKNTLFKIFARPEPYRTKIFVDVVGTENERIRFQGIPDPEGNLPVITFENSTSWGNTVNTTLESSCTVCVFGTYGNKPAFVEIVNLAIKDAPYAGIWAKGDHISVKGCSIENNANGVFFQSTNQLLIEISTYILIEGNRFVNNGTINGWLHHNIYSQGMHTLIQFNTIESVKEGALGSSLKDRSSHLIIRYNKIETSARTLDLVEPEDSDQVLMADNNWDDVYVYGNLLLNKNVPVNRGGINMVHYGYDNVSDYRREGTLYFYNNTIAIDRNDDIWRLNLFDVNSTEAVIEFSNNIITARGMQMFNIFRSNNTDNAGNINFGTSYFSIAGTQNNWSLSENIGDYYMSGEQAVIEGSDPGFLDPESNNYSLVEGSPCIASGIDLKTTIGVSVDYDSIDANMQQRNDQQNPSLGGFSYSGSTLHSTDIQHKVSVSLYPNPTEDILTIKLNNTLKGNININLYDLSGKRIYSRAETTARHQISIDLLQAALPQGIYLLDITNNDKPLGAYKFTKN